MELTVLVTCFALFGFCQDVCCMHTVSQEFLTTPQQDLSGKFYNVVSPNTDTKRILFTTPVSAINYRNRHSKEMPHVAMRLLKPQDKTSEQQPVTNRPIKASEINSSLITQGAQNVDFMNNNKTGDNPKIKELELKTESNDAKNISESQGSKNDYQMGQENCDIHDIIGAKRENAHQRNHDRKIYEKEDPAKPMEASFIEKSSSVSQEINNDQKSLNNLPSEGKADLNIISTEVENSSNHLDLEAPILRSSKNNNDDFNKPKLNQNVPLMSETLKIGENEDIQKPVGEQIQTVNDIVNTTHENALYQRGRTSPLTKLNAHQTPRHHSPQRHFNFLDSECHTYDQSSKHHSVPLFVNDEDSEDGEDCRYIPVFDWPTRWFDPKTGTYYPTYPKVDGDGGTLIRQSTQQSAMKLNNDRANMDKQNLVNLLAFQNAILPLTDQTDAQNVLMPMSFKRDIQNLNEPVFPNEMSLTYDADTENVSPMSFQPNVKKVLTLTSFQPVIQDFNQPDSLNQVLADQSGTQNYLTPVSFQPEIQESDQSAFPNMIQPLTYQLDIQNVNQRACPDAILPLGYQSEMQNDLDASSKSDNQDSDQPASSNAKHPLKYQPDNQKPNQPACQNAIFPLGYQPKIQNVQNSKSENQESNLPASPNVIQPLTYQSDIKNFNQRACPNAILPLGYQPEIQNGFAPASFEAKIRDLNQPAPPHLIQPLTYQPDSKNFNQRACPNEILPLGYQSQIQSVIAPVSFEAKIQDFNQPACPNLILPLTRQPDTQNEADPSTYEPDTSNILPSAYRLPNTGLTSKIITSYNPDLSQAQLTYQYPIENELNDLHLIDVYNNNPNLQKSVTNGQNPIGNIVYNRPRSYNRPNIVYQTKYYGLPNQYNQFDAFPAYPVEEHFQKRPYYIENYRTPYVIGPSRSQNNDVYNQIKYPEYYEQCKQQWKSI